MQIERLIEKLQEIRNTNPLVNVEILCMSDGDSVDINEVSYEESDNCVYIIEER